MYLIRLLLAIGMFISGTKLIAQPVILDSFHGIWPSGLAQDSEYIYSVIRESDNTDVLVRLNKSNSTIAKLPITGIAGLRRYILNDKYLILQESAGGNSLNPHTHRFHCYSTEKLQKIWASSWIYSTGPDVQMEYRNSLLTFSIQGDKGTTIYQFDLTRGQETGRMTIPRQIRFMTQFGNQVVIGAIDTAGHYLYSLDSRLKLNDSFTFLQNNRLIRSFNLIHRTDSNVVIEFCRDSAVSANAFRCLPRRVQFGQADSITDILLNRPGWHYLDYLDRFRIFSSPSGYHRLLAGNISPMNTDLDHDGHANYIEFLDRSAFFLYYSPIIGWNYGILDSTGSFITFPRYGKFDYRGRNHSKAKVYQGHLFIHNLYDVKFSGIHIFNNKGQIGMLHDHGLADYNSRENEIIPGDSTVWFCIRLWNNSTNRFLLTHFSWNKNKDTTLKPFVPVTVTRNGPVWDRIPLWLYSDGVNKFFNANEHIESIYLDNKNGVVGVHKSNEVTIEAAFTVPGENKAFYGRGCNVAYKFDAYGKAVWANFFGDVFSSLISSAFDRDSILWITTPANGQFTYGGKPLFSGQKGLALLKINANNGELIRAELLNPGAVTGTLEVDKMTINPKGEVFIAMFVRNQTGITRIGSFDISHTVSPANLLIKVSPEGQILWGRNIETPWRNSFGNTRVLCYDNKNFVLSAIQSQGYFNVWSSCAYMHWGYYHQVLSDDGDLLNTISFTTSDLGGITSGTYNNHSNMIVQGYYRGTLNFGSASHTTPKDRHCNLPASFRYVLDKKSGTGLVSKPENEPAYSLHMVNDGKYLYSLCVNNDKQLFILKQTQTGKPIAKLDLKQKFDRWVYYTPVNFDVNDSFIALGYAHFRVDSTYIFNQSLYYPEVYNSHAVVKIRNAGWEYFEGSPDSKSNQDFTISPNPVTGDIYLTMPQGHMFRNYRIYDMGGKLVAVGNLPGSMDAGISAHSLNSGVYILELTGPSGTKSKKFIKL